MSTSLPSPKVSVVDVPEVNDFRATFVYNFFTPDESHNDSAVAPPGARVVPASSFDATRVDNVRRTIPRFVKFDFTPPGSSHGVLKGNEFLVDRPFDRERLSIARNLSKVQTEEEFSGKLYTGFEFQDSNVDQKLFTLVSGSIAKRVTAKNRGVQQQIDENRRAVIDNLTDEHSLLDAARALADDTSEGVSNNVIVDALSQIEALKLTFVDDSGQKKLIDDTFDRVKNVTVKGQLSNKLVGRIVKNIINDPMSPFSDEFAALRPKTDAKQAAMLARFNPNIIRRAEFETEFKALTKKPIDSHDAPSFSRVIGYVIEKTEVTADGKLKKHPPVVVENGAATMAIDNRVAYGHTYIYTIRTVAQLQVRASPDEIDEVILATGLVQSRRSHRVFVQCIESIPPPSIADLNVIWSYTHSAPMLTWSFPVNPQRDIKRFQIFRRAKIDEPFQLIRELDFDDSDLRMDSGETPDPALVEKLSAPVTSYLDKGFTKESKYIYAVCSIDAHGFSSNYSLQMEVSFDQFKNKLHKRLVSNSGAPKSYPNMSLLQDTFVDSMRVSDHTRVKVVFDPEFLEVVNASGDDLGLLVTDKLGQDAKYRLQFINTDVQKLQVVDVKIKDRRTPRAART